MSQKWVPLDRAVHYDFFGPNGPSGTPDDVFGWYQIFGPPGPPAGPPRWSPDPPKWSKLLTSAIFGPETRIIAQKKAIDA